MGEYARATAKRTPAILLSKGPAGVLQRKCACGQHASGGQCEHCKKQQLLQRRAAGTFSPTIAPAIVGDVLATPGQPLDSTTREFLEPRFGYNFSQVRVHSDQRAAESARAVNAHAYTVGQDIVFGASHPPGGLSLLAHELAHVVQQCGISHGAVISHAQAEAEAESFADLSKGPTATMGSRPQGLARASGPLPAETPMSDTEMRKVLETERAFSFSEGGAPVEDPKGVGRNVGPQAGGKKAGDAVFAIVQITDREGKLVERSIGRYFGGSDEHAEAQALHALELRLVGRDLEGGEMIVVVDQYPCPPSRKNCAGLIEAFAHRFKLRRRIRVPTRGPARGKAPLGGSVEPGTAPQRVKPRTAQRGAQRSDFPPVELTDFPAPEPQAAHAEDAPATAKGAASKPPAAGKAPQTGTEGPTAKVKPSDVAPLKVAVAEGEAPGPKVTAPESEVPAPKVAVGEGEAQAPKIAVGEGEAPAPKVGVGMGTAPEVEGAGGASAGLAIFQILMLLGQLIPDPTSGKLISDRLSSKMQDAKWKARLKELQPVVQQSKGSVYYNVRFRVNYTVHTSPKPLTVPGGSKFEDVDVLAIDFSNSNLEVAGKLDPPNKPDSAKVILGGGWYWDAHQDFTLSTHVVSGEEAAQERAKNYKVSAGDPYSVIEGLRRQETGPTYKLTSDTDIRNAIAGATTAELSRIPVAEKIRDINRLLDGKVLLGVHSEDDLTAIEKLCASVSTSAEMQQINKAVHPREGSLNATQAMRFHNAISRHP